MHLAFGFEKPNVPAVIWFIMLQNITIWFLPIFFPALEETLQFVLHYYMIVVSFCTILPLILIVVRLSMNTFMATMAEREQIKNQYALSTGNADTIAELMRPDVIVIQRENEAAEAFNARVITAKSAANMKSTWVVIVPFQSTLCTIHYSQTEASSMLRSDLEWEKGMEADKKIVATGYIFSTETYANYLTYCSRFITGYREWVQVARHTKLIESGLVDEAFNSIELKNAGEFDTVQKRP